MAMSARSPVGQEQAQAVQDLGFLGFPAVAEAEGAEDAEARVPRSNPKSESRNPKRLIRAWNF